MENENGNEIKKYSLDGIYPNLRFLELSNDICIQATNNISKNTLLFEIGGEIIKNEIWIKFIKILKIGFGVIIIFIIPPYMITIKLL